MYWICGYLQKTPRHILLECQALAYMRFSLFGRSTLTNIVAIQCQLAQEILDLIKEISLLILVSSEGLYITTMLCST